MDEKLLTLPWKIQLALGLGYTAYMLAYVGIREHHKGTDTAFRAIAFGLIATLILTVTPESHQGWRIAGAVVATLLGGAVWRLLGIGAVRRFLRWTNVSWADDTPTAWLSITAARTDLRPSAIAVDLENGRTISCDDTRPFADAPHGPCVFGQDGSIALYVTAERRPDGQWFDHADIRNAKDGDRLTYVPAAAVKRVELRFWSTATSKAAMARAEVERVAVEGLAAGSEAALNPEYRSVPVPPVTD